VGGWGVGVGAGGGGGGGGGAGGGGGGGRGGGVLAGGWGGGCGVAGGGEGMGIVTSAAREAGVTIPLGAVVAQLVAAMVARGDGGLDHSGLLKLVQELSGHAG